MTKEESLERSRQQQEEARKRAELLQKEIDDRYSMYVMSYVTLAIYRGMTEVTCKIEDDSVTEKVVERLLNEGYQATLADGKLKVSWAEGPQGE